MASDYFLKVEGIPGESPDSKHKDEIEIESFSWGASNAGTFAIGGGGGAGKASFQDASFASLASKASPKLMLACATGQHIPKADLTLRKAGGKQEEFYKVTFTDVLVSSFQAAGSSRGGDTIPMDQFSLNFSKVEFEYKAQDAKGGLAGAVKAGYDVKANQKV
jgi:type VI secretion system secreted protein Hcp